MTHKQQIRDFVLKNFLFSNDSALSDDESLVRSGVIDSTGVLELILFLEENFGVTVEDEEMVPDNLDSISRVAEFVARKKAAGVAQ